MSIINTTGATDNLTLPNPAPLLDAVIAKLRLKNDAALSRALDVSPPVISKIRHLVLPVGPSLLIRIHDVAGIGLDEQRSYLGIDPFPRHGHAAV